MKLKTLVQMIVITCGIVSLVACSSTGKKNASVSDASGGGAQSMGAGDGSSFGSNMSPAESLAKRTYYFEYDRSDVSADDKAAINANGDNLIAHPSAKILLEGHTDPRGSREYNVALGEHRANAVADILKAKGVNPDQIRVISYGAERLATEGRSESDFEQDRRVVLVYLQQ